MSYKKNPLPLIVIGTLCTLCASAQATHTNKHHYSDAGSVSATTTHNHEQIPSSRDTKGGKFYMGFDYLPGERTSQPVFNSDMGYKFNADWAINFGVMSSGNIRSRDGDVVFGNGTVGAAVVERELSGVHSSIVFSSELKGPISIEVGMGIIRLAQTSYLHRTRASNVTENYRFERAFATRSSIVIIRPKLDLAIKIHLHKKLSMKLGLTSILGEEVPLAWHRKDSRNTMKSLDLLTIGLAYRF